MLIDDVWWCANW